MLSYNNSKKNQFLRALFKWHKDNERKFPWRETKNPYFILVAEIMLQKTDAKKVEPIFCSFIKSYPSLDKIAYSKKRDLDLFFASLGIKQRGERIKRLAKIIIKKDNGKIPRTKEKLMELPGVGNYISNAVLCLAFDNDVPMVDTNSIRIFERIFSIKSKRTRPRTDDKIWRIIENMIPVGNGRKFNLAILDFGAVVCKSKDPQHQRCPMKGFCNYYKKSLYLKN